MAQDQEADPTSQRTQTGPNRADEGGRSLVSGFEWLRGASSRLLGRVKRLRGPIAALAAVGAILGGFVGYWNTYRAVTDSVTPRAVQPAAAPPAFSLALMPFVAATGDPEEQRFATALTENVLALMGKSKLMRVASPRKVQEYKGKSGEPQSVGRALNVRYLVDGTVRIAENNAAITLQLTDAESGTQIWSHRLEATDFRSPHNQFEVATQVRELLGEALYEREIRRAVAHPIPGSAVDLFLQGEAATAGVRANPSEYVTRFLALRKFYDDALHIDPDFLPALLNLATLLEMALVEDLDSDRSTRAKRVDELDRITARAVSIDGGYAPVWYERADALRRLERFDQALEANAKAGVLAEIPESVIVDQQVGILLALDRPDDALAIGARSTAMFHAKNTGQEGFSHRMACISNLLVGRYAAAVAACEKSAANDDWWVDQMYLTAGYAQLGNLAKAAAAKALLISKKPTFTIEKYKASDVGTTGYHERVDAHLYAGLRKADIPER